MKTKREGIVRNPHDSVSMSVMQDLKKKEV